VDLTTEEDEEMDDTPASPSPNVSEDEMDTDEEEDLLAYHGINRDQDSSSDEDGFQHVWTRPTQHQHQRPQGQPL